MLLLFFLVLLLICISLLNIQIHVNKLEYLNGEIKRNIKSGLYIWKLKILKLKIGKSKNSKIQIKKIIKLIKLTKIKKFNVCAFIDNSTIHAKVSGIFSINVVHIINMLINSKIRKGKRK